MGAPGHLSQPHSRNIGAHATRPRRRGAFRTSRDRGPGGACVIVQGEEEVVARADEAHDRASPTVWGRVCLQLGRG